MHCHDQTSVCESCEQYLGTDLTTFDTWTEEEILDKASRPKNTYLRRGLKKARTGYSPLTPSAPSNSPSQLSTLPFELCHMILEHLDWRALAWLSQTSTSLKRCVDSFPPWRDVTTHAPEMLHVLLRRGLLDAHSPLALQQAMYRRDCVACGEFGAYLHLPSCERCCHWCLCNNVPLWVIEADDARKFYHFWSLQIFEDHLELLQPVLEFSRGFNGPFRPEFCRNYHLALPNLYSLALSLKEKAYTVLQYGMWFGSHSFSLPEVPTEPRLHFLKYSLGPRHPHWRKMPKQIPIAGILFPTLGQNGQPEEIFWCKGCQALKQGFRRKSSEYLICWRGDLLKHPEEALKKMESQARPKVEFLEHLKTCRMAHEICRSGHLK